MTAAKYFNAAYESNEVATIEYNPKWENGTGYYDKAACGKHAPILQVGEMVKTCSPNPNNRKIILIGTPVGNMVVFQRFANGDGGVHLCNTHPSIHQVHD